MRCTKKWVFFSVALTMLFTCVSCSQELGHNNMPTGIILAEYNMDLEVGEEYILHYELQPLGSFGAVTFASSDYSVINIIEGKLVAVSMGTATVTVETENHITSACNITVINKPAIEQMTEDETAFYETLLSNVNDFNVPSSVRVVRVKSLGEDGEKYLAMLQANNLLGVTLSGQYIITIDGIEKTSEIIQAGDQQFRIDLINQALEEYWGLDNANIENDKKTTTKDELSIDDEEYNEQHIEQRENCDFRNCKWGDTREEVKLYDTTLKILSDKEDTFIGTDNVSGYSDTAVSYFFNKDGKLYSGMYVFSYKKKEVWEYISMYDSLAEKLTNLYGQPKRNEIVPVTSQYLIDISDPITAVRLGYVYYSAIWETPTTNISLALMTENYETNLAIKYIDANYDETSDNSGL